MNQITPLPIERFRSYLLLLARMHIDVRGPARIEPSDIVQQTMLEAHRSQEQFAGDEAGLAAWLRKILAHNIHDAIRRQRRQRRDVRRETSLEEGLRQSESRLASCVADRSATPSERAVRCEELLEMADCLLLLPTPQQEAIVLHHLREWTIAEVAAQLGRSEAAVAGLLHRGLRRLRQLMGQTPDPRRKNV